MGARRLRTCNLGVVLFDVTVGKGVGYCLSECQVVHGCNID